MAGCALTLPLGLGACGSSSSTPTTTSTTVQVSAARCDLVTPAQIYVTVGVTVAQPRATVNGTTTLCTYKASDLSRSIIVGFDSKATTTSFTDYRALLRTRGDHVGLILGLGDSAYYAVATTGGTTVRTVVTRKGSDQVLVTGTATLTQLEILATHALTKVTS